MPATLTIVRREQSFPKNYSYAFLTGDRYKNEVKVTLENGRAISCSRHRSAHNLAPCACIEQANADPEKDQYWIADSVEADYSDLIDD